MQHDPSFAALDLGSNSFRLEIGRVDHGQIQWGTYLKETVRLGSGFDEARNLSAESMKRGWDCLTRFAERLKGFEPHQVRAVATQTLREASNRQIFLERANAILGFPIEVISGTEEARLIYQGVSHFLPQSSERRLVIDIGGRSTELVLGQGARASKTASFRVGSVSWSMRYFPKGEFTEQAIYRAEIAAQAVLEESLTGYARDRWDVAYGASGTVGAVADILALAGWPAHQITHDGLNWLIKCLLRAGNVDNVHLDGLKDDRRQVIGGGVTLLRGLMELLHIDTLTVARGALRHGVLLEMVQRGTQATDARDESVLRLSQKFAVDVLQADRVANAASFLLGQMLPEKPGDTAQFHRKLRWAGQLHEVGMAISHSDYHKHGAYILANADIVGFSMPELYRLGLLVLGHRGKLKKLDSGYEQPEFVMQLLALRLAVIFCHARQTPSLQGCTLTCHLKKQRFTLSVPSDWAAQHPLTLHLLNQESASWQRVDWSLEVIVAEP